MRKSTQSLLQALQVLSAPNKVGLWLLVLIAGLITLASYWVLEIIQGRARPTSGTVRTRPDYYVENFNFIKMLPNGQNKYHIVGTKLVHYQNDDHADVTLPVLSNLDPSQSFMTVRSERATIKNVANRAENEIYLYDKVVVYRPESDKAEYLQLNTDYLVAYPDKNILQTNFPVEILSKNTVTTGVGMKANTVTQQVQILSNVSSVIAPYTGQKKPASKK